MIHSTPHSLSTVGGPTAAAAPRGWLGVLIHRSQPRPSETESLEGGPSYVCFLSFPSDSEAS